MKSLSTCCTSIGRGGLMKVLIKTKDGVWQPAHINPKNLEKIRRKREVKVL